MKNLKKLLALSLGAALALSVLAGCDLGLGTNGDNGGNGGGNNNSNVETPSSYSVTLNYDSTQGTVTVSAPDSDGKYTPNSEVTVTVAPSGDFAVTGLKVNGVAHAFVANQFTFKITQDTTVEVEFMDLSDVPNVEGLGEYGFKTLFEGSWIATTGDTLQIIKNGDNNKLIFNGKAVTSVLPQGDADNEQVYRFTADEHNYMLSWADIHLSEGYVLSLLDADSESRVYFVRGGEEALGGGEIVESYRGDWRTEGIPSHATKLTITANSIDYNGRTPQYIVDGGERDILDDGYQTPIYNNIYFFIIDNQLYKLVWYNSSSPTAEDNITAPVINNVYYVPDVDVPYTFPESFRGTWRTADTTVVITETKLTINGEEIPVEGNYTVKGVYNPYNFFLNWKGTSYTAEFRPSATNGEYVMQFVHGTYNASGDLTGSSYIYFISDKAPGATLNEVLDGTWKFKGEQDIVIDVEHNTIKWGDMEGIIIAPGEDRTDGGFVYYVLFGDQVCTVSYLDAWAGDIGDSIDKDGDGEIEDGEFKEEGDEKWVLMVDVSGKPTMYFEKAAE